MIEGKIQSVGWGAVSGWALDSTRPEKPVILIIAIDGETAGRVIANIYRPRLARKRDDGRFGFLLPITGLATDRRHVIEARCEETGIALEGSPWMLEPATRMDDAVRAYLAQMADAAAPEDRDSNLAFIAGLTGRLLTARTRDAQEQHRLFAERWGAENTAAPDATSRALLIHGILPPEAPIETLLAGHVAHLKQAGHQIAIATMNLAPIDAAILQKLGATGYSRPFCATIEEVLQGEKHHFAVIAFAHPELARLYGPLAHRHNPSARIIVARREAKSGATAPAGT